MSRKRRRELQIGDKRVKHGAYSFIATGELPPVPWAERIRGQGQSLEDALYEEVAAIRGRPPSPSEAGLILSARDHETYRRCFRAYAADKDSQLTPMQRATLLLQAGSEGDKRDRAIAALKLDEPIEVTTYVIPDYRADAHQNAPEAAGTQGGAEPTQNIDTATEGHQSEHSAP